uniref:Ubiquitin-like protease family profile domain-containing protein n=1 Tax=Plectus sambesii TaxID=2011161 RepID=A0A914X3E9_9BILA
MTSQPTSMPSMQLPTADPTPNEYPWPTEESWLTEPLPPKHQSPATDKPLPSTVTNIMDDDLNTLRGKAWLNDKVIDSYLALIKARSQLASRERVYAFLTHFNTMLCSRGYTGARSWVKVDIFSHDLLFFPIHDHGNHWTLIVVDMRLWRISYYDSMGNDGNHHLNTISNYLEAEFPEKKAGEHFVPFTCVNEKRLPQQQNTRDCGVFLCQFAEHVARGAPLTFTQTDMPRFRLQMERELKEGRLLQ